MSYVARIGEKADKDAVITEILLKQGVSLIHTFLAEVCILMLMPSRLYYTARPS
jgi:hypothetical protein